MFSDEVGNIGKRKPYRSHAKMGPGEGIPLGAHGHLRETTGTNGMGTHAYPRIPVEWVPTDMYYPMVSKVPSMNNTTLALKTLTWHMCSALMAIQ
jgi:hypothetical protein